MLGAELRDFNSTVAQVDHALPDAFHLIAKNQGQLVCWQGHKIRQKDTFIDLLDRKNAIAVLPELANLLTKSFFGSSQSGLGEQKFIFQVPCLRLAFEGLDGTFHSGADGELEALYFAVTELNILHGCQS